VKPVSLPPGLATHFDDIDQQHAQLLTWARALVLDDPDGTEEERKRVLAFLLFYVEQHFTTEEAAMRDLRYPAFGRHRAEHVALGRQVAAVARQSSTGLTLAVAERIYDLITAWLPGHIHEHDTDLAAFIRSKKARIDPLPDLGELFEGEPDLPAWMIEALDGPRER
jgi:hemerythrin